MEDGSEDAEGLRVVDNRGMLDELRRELEALPRLAVGPGLAISAPAAESERPARRRDDPSSGA